MNSFNKGFEAAHIYVASGLKQPTFLSCEGNGVSLAG
jgi:hypothetical protein